MDQEKLAKLVKKRIHHLLEENKTIYKMKEERKRKMSAENYCITNPTPPKLTSHLIRRDDVEFKEFIEDAPIGGYETDLYIGMCEFDDLQIIRELQKLDIQILSLIKIQDSSMPDDTIWPVPDVDNTPQINNPNKIEEWWQFLIRHRFNKEKIQITENMFTVKYDKTYNYINRYVKEEVDKYTKIVYDEISYLLYEMGQMSRIYNKYIQKMKIYKYPSIKKNLPVKLNVQHNLNIPMECFSIYQYLDTILNESVRCLVENCNTSLSKRESVTKKMKSGRTKHRSMKSLINDKVKQFNKIYNLNDVYITGDLQEYNPKTISFGNDVEIDSFHYDVPEIILQTVSVLEEVVAVNLQRAIQNFSSSDKAYIINFIKSGGTSFEYLKQIIHWYVFNKMTDSSNIFACINHCTSKAANALVGIQRLHNFFHRATNNFNCSNTTQIIELTKYCHRDNIMKDFLHFETMPKLALMQYIIRWLQKRCDVDYEYFALTDTLLLHLRAPERPVDTTISDVTLPTPVCMRDFYDFVQVEQDEWIKREKHLDENQSLIKEILTEDDNILRSSHLHVYFNDMLIKGSIKHMQYLKQIELEHEAHATKSEIDIADRYDLNLINTAAETVHKFIGYDMGPLRVQLQEIDTHFYGTHATITVQLLEWMYEEPRLYIDIDIHGHHLYYNNFIGPTYEKTPTNFHIIFETGIIVAFERICVSKTERANDDAHLEFSCRGCWPNGLQISLVELPSGEHIIEQNRRQEKMFTHTEQKPSTFTHVNTYITRQSMSCVQKTLLYEEPVTPIIELKSDTKRLFSRDGTVVAFQDNNTLLYCLNGDLFLFNNVSKSPNEEQRSKDLTKVIRGNGEQYLKRKDKLIKKGRLGYTEYRDYKNEEIFVRRNDGTNLLFVKDRLITTFPDKTIITSYCYVEKESILFDCCNFVEDYNFVTKSKVTEEEFNLNEDDQDERSRTWILVSLNVIFEHPRYATTSYERPDCYHFDLNKELQITVSKTGSYHLITNTITLDVFDGFLTIYDNDCPSTAKSTIFFPNKPELKVPSVILMASDCSQVNKFCVNGKGKCHWNKEREKFDKKKHLNITCCPKKEFHEFIVLNKEMEGGRFMSNVKFEEIVSSIKDCDGFIFKDKIEEANIEITEVLVPQEPTNIWKSKISEVIPSYQLKPNTPKLGANSNKFDLEEQKVPEQIIKALPECFIARYFNEIPSLGMEEFKTMLKKYEAEIEGLVETKESITEGEFDDEPVFSKKGPAIEPVIEITKDIHLESKFEKLTNKAISALKERYAQMNEQKVPEEVHNGPKPRELDSTKLKSLEDRKNLILRKALKEGKVFNFFEVAEIVNAQELGEFYADHYENGFNEPGANSS